MVNTWTSIYGLYDPREPNMIMYVGKGGPKRAESHWKVFLKNGTASNVKLRAWFEKLTNSGIKPEIIILNSKIPGECWEEHEIKYIAKWRKINPNLCNVHPGGNCSPKQSQHFGGVLGYQAMRKSLSHENFLRNQKNASEKGGFSLVHKLHPGKVKEWGLKGAQALLNSGRTGWDLAHANHSESEISTWGRKGGLIAQKNPNCKLGLSQGRHTRWHVLRNVVDFFCPHCFLGHLLLLESLEDWT